MSDVRRKADGKRRETLTIKLHAHEIAALAALADRNYRSPGDQVRLLIAEAVRAAGLDAGDEEPKP